MLSQSQQQRLQQKLSRQQIQFIKLLQVPTAALEQRVEQELEENPALVDPDTQNNDPDEAADPYQDDEKILDPEDSTQTEFTGDDGQEQEANEVSIDEYLHENEYENHRNNTYDDGEERYEAPIVQLNSLYDSLRLQIGMLELDDTEYLIAEHVVGSIDEDGYFRRSLQSLADELVLRQNLHVSEEQVENVLAKVQTLEPAGVGAVDLQHCLLLQLERRPRSPEVDLAEQIIMDQFEEFSRKHFDKIIDKLNCDPDLFKQAYHLITKLNPKPGESESVVKHAYIVPDFLLTVEEGQIEIKLNRRNAPDLHVNRRYLKMMQELSRKENKGDANAKETLQFVRQKVESARWFIDALRQRQYTLMNTMSTIAEKQKEFFIYEGDESRLKPMILKDVATEIEMDISTVSRVANSKYVQTDFGIYPLKFFFSEGIATDSGEEVSNREVKKILAELIGAENKRKPLSDDKLAEMLNDRGYNIARRTVAKYREQLNVSVARLRKEL